MRTTMIRRRGMLAAAALLAPAVARAQGSDRPLRIVVPFPPGGTSDLVARIIQPELQRLLGQAVVVDNRGGAAGNLGADHVAKSAPDGTTVLLTDPGILTTSPSLFARLPYNPASDLDPVTMLIYAPYIMAVHPGMPVRNGAELAGYVKANPGRVNFAHSGVGALNHLTALVAVQHWGGEVTEVFYRGGMLGIQAAATGESQLIVNGATATLPFVTDGRLRAIAVTGPRRLAEIPDVPTFAELGWPAAEAGIWQALMAPARTPAPVVARLNAAFAEALAVPAVKDRLAGLGAEVRTEGPDSLRRWLAAETELWGGIIRARGIKLD
ncbi:Bug family tripartite tricarboxylate transporter substrate binding protein [Falsiroseomonas ponticola]|uniref:Bug family tripartite tricarboxylate transporter substrate binding protein n=1 Tax=Falsiroseomonas ponticola TaxID=2786951 RepID=UPI001CF7AED4|nr:tripartite tricarboxylate transporter substrate-binding protein [Roseomonas ponticola]